MAKGVTLDDLRDAMAAILAGPRTEPFKLYASGPNVERVFREIYGDTYEIVRTDIQTPSGSKP